MKAKNYLAGSALLLLAIISPMPARARLVWCPIDQAFYETGTPSYAPTPRARLTDYSRSRTAYSQRDPSDYFKGTRYGRDLTKPYRPRY